MRKSFVILTHTHRRFHSPIYWLSGLWMLEGMFWAMAAAFSLAVLVMWYAGSLTIRLIIGVVALLLSHYAGRPTGKHALRP
jgi:hypothetical protein